MHTESSTLLQTQRIAYLDFIYKEIPRVLLSALIVAEQYRFYYKSQDKFDGIMTCHR